MRITQHQVDKNGDIIITNVVRLLTMGIQKNVVTVWAVTDPLNTGSAPVLPRMKFKVRKDNDALTKNDLGAYITSFINDDGIWHLFGVPQEFSQVGFNPAPPGAAPIDPAGRRRMA